MSRGKTFECENLKLNCFTLSKNVQRVQQVVLIQFLGYRLPFFPNLTFLKIFTKSYGKEIRCLMIRVHSRKITHECLPNLFTIMKKKIFSVKIKKIHKARILCTVQHSLNVSFVEMSDGEVSDSCLEFQDS